LVASDEGSCRRRLERKWLRGEEGWG
jgi:hypothetical protein